MVGEQNVKIGGVVPDTLRENIIVQVIEEIVIRIRIEKSAIYPVFSILEVFADVMVHHGGYTGHGFVAEFSGISPERDLAVELCHPVFNLLVVILLIFFPGSGDCDLHCYVLRDVAFRHEIVRQVCHLRYDTFYAVLSKAIGDFRCKSPHIVAYCLVVFFKIASAFSCFSTFLATAPIEPILWHEVEISGSRSVYIPCTFPPSKSAGYGSGLPRKKRFDILINDLAHAAVETDMSGVRHVRLYVATAVLHQGKIFRMGLAEALFISQSGKTVSKRNYIALHAQAQKVQIDPFYALVTFVLVPFSVIMHKCTPNHVGTVQNVDHRRKYQRAFIRNNRSHFTREKEPCICETLQKIIYSVQGSTFVYLRPLVLCWEICCRINPCQKYLIAIASDVITISREIGDIEPVCA